MLATNVVVTARLENCRAETINGLLASSFHAYNLSADAFARSLRLLWSGFTRPAQPSDSKLRAGGERLSSRERQVLLQVVEGQSNKAIAVHLGTTEAAVKVCLETLLRKIRVENRTQVTIWALGNLPELATRVAA